MAAKSIAGMSLFRNNPALLAAFRNGERAALEQVYRAYVQPIDRLVRALARGSGCPDLAQGSAVADLVQEIFVRAFSAGSRRGYDGLRDFSPYLATIARNCFVDAQRARGREMLKNPEELSLLIDDEDAAAAEPEPWGDARVMAVLSDYLRALPPELAGTYRHRFVLGQSQEAASAALGLSRRSLRTAEGKLRRGLRKALARAGISRRDLHSPGAAETAGDPRLAQGAPAGTPAATVVLQRKQS